MILLNYLLDIWNGLISVFASMSLIDYLDIILLAVILYIVIKLVHETRAEQLIKGIVVMAIALFIFNQLGFKAMGMISDMFYNVGVLAVIVMFQPELRRALEKVGRAKVGQISFLDSSVTGQNGAQEASIQQIGIACERLSRTATGALIVLERATKLGEQIDTGTIVNAMPSEQLFCNIFFPNTPLHDGAVIMRDGLIHAAGCFLPKPQKEELVPKELGTRHRAAIGISEVSDAVVVVVSEETGIISVAENGQLERGFDREKLVAHLRKKMLPEDEKAKKSKKNAGNTSKNKKSKEQKK